MDKWYFADQLVNIAINGMENGDATAQLIVDKLGEYDNEFILKPLLQAAFKYETCTCRAFGAGPPQEGFAPLEEDDEDDYHEHEEVDDPGPLGRPVGQPIGNVALPSTKCGFCLMREEAKVWVTKKKFSDELMRVQLEQAIAAIGRR